MTRDDLLEPLELLAIGAVGLTTRALAQAPTGMDLTFPQWRALLIVGETDDGARIGTVAARVGVTLPATGRLLRRLESRGLVALATDPVDHRATRASITVRGHEVRSAILEFRRIALREIVGSIDAADQVGAVVVLEALADAFRRYA